MQGHMKIALIGQSFNEKSRIFTGRKEHQKNPKIKSVYEQQSVLTSYNFPVCHIGFAP